MSPPFAPADVPLDALRPPAPGDPSAAAYKDWLHLNVFLPEAGVVALINGSLHGPPHDPRARAVGVGLACAPSGDWLGGVEVAGHAAGAGPDGVLLETVAIAAGRDRRRLHAAVRRPADGLEASVVATPAARGFGFALEAPFGSGWIGWSVQPLLALAGTLRIDGVAHALDGAFGYHDHNWGRWFWGEDVAWEWGAFMFPGPAAFVFARACDRAHEAFGPAHAFLVREGATTAFRPGRVALVREGRLAGVERRLPGALAAIHPDRRRPDLPARLRITAEAPGAACEIDFAPGSAAQLILAEPTRPGTAFINELAGPCRLSALIGRTRVAAEGQGVFEHVE